MNSTIIKTCDCCYESKKNIIVCKYNHSVCHDCQELSKRSDCLFCNPLDKIIDIPQNLTIDLPSNIIIPERRDSCKNIIIDHLNGIFIISVTILYVFICGVILCLEWWLFNEIIQNPENKDFADYTWYKPSFWTCILGTLIHTCLIILGFLYLTK